MAVQIGVLQDAVGFFAADVEVSLENDPVLGQRAGLVGAQDVHRAEILDGVETLDHDLGARHGGGALRQVDRHDHRQHFRREAHGDRHREQQGLKPIVLGQSIDQKDQRSHHGDEPDHQPGEAVDASVECGGARAPGDLIGELTEKCLRAGAHDNAGGVAADDVGAHETNIRQVERVGQMLNTGVGIFLGRHRLPGQRRLIDE